ncbi:MAG: hypothetical protein [Caudoviricetes sp.]|nr:MAG: hypothetical protein [Caudoviricetes sp.]
MEVLKKCFKCGIEKPYSEYYKHKQTSDGYLGKCKSCTKSDVRARELELSKDHAWIESERYRCREKYHRLGYKDIHKPSLNKKYAIMDIYDRKYPEKYIARNLSQRVEAPKGFHRHHWSYNTKDAKDVIILSPKDHLKAHRFLIYDQERFMYRRFDNNELLDTRCKHEEFILKCIKEMID